MLLWVQRAHHWARQVGKDGPGHPDHPAARQLDRGVVEARRFVERPLPSGRGEDAVEPVEPEQVAGWHEQNVRPAVPRVVLGTRD